MSDCQGSSTMRKNCENHEECMKMIQAVLDGSATDSEIEHFKNNIENCEPCIKGYELEKSIKESLQGKVEKKCCPGNTIDQLRLKLGISAVLFLGVMVHFSTFFCK
jgi:anti-sigma factor (TIGR02949 family)